MITIETLKKIKELAKSNVGPHFCWRDQENNLFLIVLSTLDVLKKDETSGVYTVVPPLSATLVSKYGTKGTIEDIRDYPYTLMVMGPFKDEEIAKKTHREMMAKVLAADDKYLCLLAEYYNNQSNKWVQEIDTHQDYQLGVFTGKIIITKYGQTSYDGFNEN